MSNDLCKNNHDTRLTGRRPNGRCRACCLENYRRWCKRHPGRQAQQNKDWKTSHPEASRESARKWAQKNPNHNRVAAWKSKGIVITVPEYDRLFAEQNGQCAICKTDRHSLTRNLAVDHNRITGKVRGLLCNYCNAVLLNAVENAGHFIPDALRYLSERN